MGRDSIFRLTGGLRLRKHKFVLNYHKFFDCDAGQLIPVAFEECVPGDIVRLGNEALVRANPMIKPIFGKLTYHTYSFFIPTWLFFGEMKTDAENHPYWDPDRKLFETFLSGGVDGKDNSVSLPYWVPTGGNVRNDAYYEWTVGGQSYSTGIVADNGVGSLWDYFGLPTGIIPKVYIKDENGDNVEMPSVLDFPRMAYNMVYGEYFRDQNLMDYPDIHSSIVRNKCWKKDLFTSALPWQQRGTAPALPITLDGVLPVSFLNTYQNEPSVKVTGFMYPSDENGRGTSSSNPSYDLSLFTSRAGDNNYSYAYRSSTVQGSVDASGVRATSFDVNDLRAAVQIQKWLERSARGGTRMKEILLSHFGTAPSDEVLNRPAFIGHTSAPIYISEVLQTSESTDESSQGNLAGHGVSASRNYIGSWHAKEFGYILTLACIVPETSYTQGINRQFSKFSKWDFMWPELLFLGEEAVRQQEVYAGNDSEDNAEVFGFQSRYYELRSRQNIVCGSFRSDLNFWHMGREFEDAPLLNESFVKMVPTKRIFASIDKPGFLVDHFNVHTWYRPIPHNIEPGYVDHM